MKRRGLLLLVAAAAALPGAARAQADAVETLRAFVRDVKSGSAQFTQVVTSSDGARRRTSSGRFEFQRPNRFRFEYQKPFAQTIVADGEKVWIFDAELNQASSRRLAQALGATPAALLAGGSLDADFELRNDGSADGLDWALALPRAKDGPFERMRVGFSAGTLAAVEIVDSFGQRSRLSFTDFAANVSFPATRWRFTPPPGADVIEQ
jgi:outer membrane lipoprotein carrier protein